MFEKYCREGRVTNIKYEEHTHTQKAGCHKDWVGMGSLTDTRTHSATLRSRFHSCTNTNTRDSRRIYHWRRKRQFFRRIHLPGVLGDNLPGFSGTLRPSSRDFRSPSPTRLISSGALQLKRVLPFHCG